MSEDTATSAHRRAVIRPSECEESRPCKERHLYNRDTGWAPDVTEEEKAVILDRQRKYPCVPAGKEKAYRARTDYGRVR